ncbi:MAG: GPO family capsid scaffolding protein [Moraxella sp.]|nr:GPO family capsid scaffolding protein [Moraxella sp.]
MTTSALTQGRTIKRFRVAREGLTVDGRTLSRQDLIDIAETYDPAEYTARINVEHTGGMLGLNADSYPILGDVVACDYKIESFTINGKTEELVCLYATLSALPGFVEANRAGKKLFSSIEYYKNFAGTGRAYLVGLAVTDIPASRGTEPLKFSHSRADSLHGDLTPMEMMTMTHTTPTPENTGFLEKMSALFSKKERLSETEQTAILAGFESLSAENHELRQSLSALTDAQTTLERQITLLSDKLSVTAAALDELKQTLSDQTAATAITVISGGDYGLTEF